MNIKKESDYYYNRLLLNNEFVKDAKLNKQLTKRIRKLFRQAYAVGFSDGLYCAQDFINNTMADSFDKLQPEFELLGVDAIDKKW